MSVCASAFAFVGVHKCVCVWVGVLACLHQVCVCVGSSSLGVVCVC